MTNQTLLLGIDIGTSACKAVLFRLDGSAAAYRTEPYPISYPNPGYVEQDPENWWDAVCRAVRGMLEQENIDPKTIAGVGVDGQGWSAIMMDKTGRVLTGDPIWLDARSEAVCKELEQRIGEDAIFALSGNPLKAQYTTGKLLWFKKHMPEVYESCDKVMQSNGYIVYKLTGVCGMDISQGYGLHCFDMRKGRYDDAMCAQMGLQRDMLPELSGCHEVVGRVSETAAAQTGLCAGTPVVAGGLDAACATLGAGVLHPGETQEQGGQAGGMSVCMDTYCAEKSLILGYHVVPDCWLLQGGTTGGGGAMRWFEQELGAAEREQAAKLGCNSFECLSALAESVAAGSDGVVFLPYMAGERSPIWDSRAKGVYYGLDYGKKRAHMVRALMEGVAYALLHNIETAEAVGAPVGTLRAVGGSANSRIWTQIKADVTGKPIEVPQSDMATTLGAAILAGVGVGAYRDFDEAVQRTVRVTRTFLPGDRDREAYQNGYETYRALYDNLRELMALNGRHVS
ncbi:MAG: FGGY-family carbohydrate kinase [Eubacteriales bacterium]|nr:FGGY-family carbohydrate kinase [Eubacteriales bacterium]